MLIAILAFRGALSQDRIGMECWYGGGCTEDDGSICAYCGLHEGLDQISCRHNWENNHHLCPSDSSAYGENLEDHVCVVPDCATRTMSNHCPNIGDQNTCLITME